MQEFLKETHCLFMHLLLGSIPKLSLWTTGQLRNQKRNIFG